MRLVYSLIFFMLFIACKDKYEMDFAGTSTYKLDINEKQEVITKPILDEYESLGLNDTLTPLPLHRVVKSADYRLFISLSIGKKKIDIQPYMKEKLIFLEFQIANNKDYFFAKKDSAFILGCIYDKELINGTVALFFVSNDSIKIRQLFNHSDFLTKKVKDE
ncbi:MAG: hypothetical protein OHK0038_19750 [Flammeovirgaceae bacterium]